MKPTPFARPICVRIPAGAETAPKRQALLREYVDARLAVVQVGALEKLPALMVEADRVQRELWDMAVVNARKDMNSDVAALYVEALNEVTNLHWLRVAVGLQARIPNTIWLALFALVALGMLAVGYQTAHFRLQ